MLRQVGREYCGIFQWDPSARPQWIPFVQRLFPPIFASVILPVAKWIKDGVQVKVLAEMIKQTSDNSADYLGIYSKNYRLFSFQKYCIAHKTLRESASNWQGTVEQKWQRIYFKSVWNRHYLVCPPETGPASVCWSVYRLGPDWNMSTSNRWIGTNFYTDIYGSNSYLARPRG